MTREADAVRKLFFIQNKDGVKVPFVFNNAQLKLDSVDNPYGRTRIIIAKARQLGFSSSILSKFTIRCLGNEGRHAVVMSHEADATQRLLDRAQYYLKHMRGPKPMCGRNSRQELYFPKTESTYFIGTAGSRAFGRGDFVTDLHCSEYAFWPEPERHATGLFQAVPWSGRIYIESTGNGRNNDFFYYWTNAEQMGYQRLFCPWFETDEYELDPPSSDGVWRPDCGKHNARLLDLKHKYKLSDRKMAWYEMKFKELREDWRMMQQEYPSEAEECFQATGGTVFNNVNYTYNPLWQADKLFGYYCYHLTNHPQPNLHYAVGGDPSGGTGHDDAAIVVFCIETNEQVFELSSNTINPLEFAKLLIDVGNLYNTAYIVCEANNHGAAVIPYLKTHYPQHMLFKSKLATRVTPARFGWYNTRLTKHQIIGLMQEWLDQVSLYGLGTVKELKAFEETPEGDFKGRSDNLVIATGLAMMGLKRFSHLRTEYLTPRPALPEKPKSYMYYTFDEIMENLEKRRHASIFPKQTDPYWRGAWN
jgi:hypothetical protein